MANKVIEIEIKADGLNTIKSQIDEIKSSLEALGEIQIISDEAIGKLKKVDDATKKLGDTSKKSGASIGDIAKGFGLMKIGEAILGKLTDLFMENATIANAMEIANRALSMAFRDFFNYISDNIGNIQQFFKDIFENPKEALIDFANAIKDNLIERFVSLLDMVGYLGSALAKLFKGDFKGAMDDAGKAAKEQVDIWTGVNNTFDKTVEVVSELTKKYTALATAQINSENAAKIASANAKVRAEQLDREAEQLRQIVGNTELSVQARINANNKLKNVVLELQKARAAEAAADVLIAKNAVALNPTIENRTKLIQAQGDALEALSDAEVAVTETITQGASLQKELNQLNQTAINGIAERAQAEKDFTSSSIIDTTDRLEAQKQALIDSQKLEEDRLNEIVRTSAVGTQARADAEQAILTSRQKLGQDLITNERATAEAVRAERDMQITTSLGLERTTNDQKLALLDEQLAMINSKTYQSEAERTAAVEANSKARNEIAKIEAENKLKLLDAVGQGLSAAADELGESTAAGKVAAIAAATISTYTAIAGQLAAFSSIPIPGFAIAQAIVTGAMGLLQVKKILQVKTPKGGAGGSAPTIGGKGSAPLTPQVNLVGNATNLNTATATGNEALNNQNFTVTAVVSETEITNKQAFISKVKSSAGI